MLILTEILDRIKADSPRFFIVLRYLFAVLAGVFAIIKWVISKQLWSIGIDPDTINEVAGYVFTVCASIWGMTYLAKKDAAETKK